MVRDKSCFGITSIFQGTDKKAKRDQPREKGKFVSTKKSKPTKKCKKGLPKQVCILWFSSLFYFICFIYIIFLIRYKQVVSKTHKILLVCNVICLYFSLHDQTQLLWWCLHQSVVKNLTISLQVSQVAHHVIPSDYQTLKFVVYHVHAVRA